MKTELQPSWVAHAALHLRGKCLTGGINAVVSPHLQLHIYIYTVQELNRDWFIDIVATPPRDLEEQAPAEQRDREDKVINNE